MRTESYARVTLHGRAYPFVSNAHAKVGTATRIFQKPVTREDIEGVAIVRSISRTFGGEPESILAEVEFTDEPGQRYSRIIYRS